MSNQNKNKLSIPNSFSKYIPKGDRENYIEYYHCEASREIRKILRKVAEDKIETATIASERKGRYELPCWAEYQADEVGYRRALREMVALLDR